MVEEYDFLIYAFRKTEPQKYIPTLIELDTSLAVRAGLVPAGGFFGLTLSEIPFFMKVVSEHGGSRISLKEKLDTVFGN